MSYSTDNLPRPHFDDAEIIIGCLDRIIALLEAQVTPAPLPGYFIPPPALICPKCGDGGMLGIAQNSIVCGTCGYSWKERAE